MKTNLNISGGNGDSLSAKSITDRVQPSDLAAAESFSEGYAMSEPKHTSLDIPAEEALAALDIAVTALGKLRGYSEVAHDAYERILRVSPAAAPEFVKQRERLRAAAPELFDACQLLLGCHDAAVEGGAGFTPDVVALLQAATERAAAAIAKAEGR